MPNTNSRLPGDDREAQKRLAENHKPLTPGQRDDASAYSLACRDLEGQECKYEAAASSMNEVRDSMMRHYIDDHPGHKIDDALQLALASRYTA